MSSQSINFIGKSMNTPKILQDLIDSGVKEHTFDTDISHKNGWADIELWVEDTLRTDAVTFNRDDKNLTDLQKSAKCLKVYGMTLNAYSFSKML